ncbi:MAG: T9SS type A sorting domain-containing protein [Ferruginibacter sp.]
MKIYLQILLFFFTVSTAAAQSLTINTNSKLVMRGKVFLVVRNAALINNGTLSDSAGTVAFSGHKDTLYSYLGGSQATTLFNLHVNKTAFGTALKSAVAVRNVLGVYGGTLYPDSNLTLRSDQHLTARVDVIPAGADIKGKSIVERYFPGKRSWRLLTSPLASTTSIFDSWQNKGAYIPGVNTWITGPNPSSAAGNGLDPSPLNNSSLKVWNEATQTLDPVLNTHVWLSPKNNSGADNLGYFMFVRGDRDYNNFSTATCNSTTLRSNGQLQVGSQTFTYTGNGYMLIGNPFASPVNFNAVQRVNVVKRFYAWDPSLNSVGGYVMLDDLDNDGIFTKSINISSQTNHLQSGQAVFVQTQSNGPATVSFPENSKCDGNNIILARPQAPAGNAGDFQSLRIVLGYTEADGSLVTADGILLECADQFSNQVDRDDALKFGNINETLSFLRNGRSMAAERKQQLTDNDTLFLKLVRSTQRKYSFYFDAKGMNEPGLVGWLEDSYLATSQPLNLQQPSAVEFAVDGNAASAATDRFRIVFKKAATVPVSLLGLNAYKKEEFVIVKWKVENEINISGYQVQRSADGIHFTTIATKAAAGGGAEYEVTDEQPLPGNNFYRIQYAEANGAVKYSDIVVVKNNEDKEPSFGVYPNPVVNNTINLKLNNFATGKYNVKLLTESGQVVYETGINNQAAGNAFVIRPGVKLVPATYLLQLSSASSKTVTGKIMVSQ